MPRVLFLMPTKTYRAKAFLSAAQKLPLEVVVGSEQRQALENFTDNKTLTLDFYHYQTAVDQILKFADKNQLHAIIPVDEETSVIASLASKALSLPHNPPEAAFASREKHRMRELLADAGLSSAKFKIFKTSDNFALLSEKMKYPVVLKPLFLSGSKGVIRVNCADEFVSACKRIKAILSAQEVRRLDAKLSKKILAEDYIPGDEVAMEGILTDSRLKMLAIFDKPDPLEGPYFEETIYVTPSRLSDKMQQQIKDTIDRAAKAMDIRHGPIHAELRINENGVWLIEIASRSIGGLCAKTLRFNGDISLEELILRHAIGEPIEGLQREKLASGVMMIPIPKAGILTAIKGLDTARRIKHIEEIQITIPISQKVVPLPEGNQYLGFIFSRADEPNEVEQALKKAHSKLEFTIT